MKILLFLISLFISSAHAADVGVVSIAQTVTDAIHLAGADKIMPLALMWIGSFMLIQFIITNIGLLKSGADLDAVWAKFLGSLFWFAFCLYLLKNGPDFIDSVGGGILERFAGFPKPGWIISATLLLCTPFLAAIATVGIVNTTLAMVLLSAMLTVLAVGMMLALKIMMLTIELGLIVMLSPLSFSLLGLNALKDQGIAPLKSLLSLIYRIILLSVICVAFTELITVATQNLKDIGGATQWLNPLNWPSIINIIMSTVLAFPVIGYFIFKSDSIAATLAGGSSNLGSGDVAGAAAAGAAAGAALMSGGAAAAGAATKPAQSMANFMQGLRGGGSVSNASSMGMGGATSSLPLSPPPMASMGSGGGGGSGAQAATPAFETNKAGAPMNPDPNANVAGPANSNAGGGASSTVQAAKDFVATNPGTPKTSKDISDFANTLQPSSATSPGGAAPDATANAGIGGTSNQPTAAQGQGGYKKTGWDHAKELNQHIAQEKSSTSVSINTHHSD